MGIRYIEDINEEMNINIVVHMDLQSKSACNQFNQQEIKNNGHTD
ncbi:hypothetical protein [Peribacillus sp. Hz7]